LPEDHKNLYTFKLRFLSENELMSYDIETTEQLDDVSYSVKSHVRILMRPFINPSSQKDEGFFVFKAFLAQLGDSVCRN
jgi:hypothetical protein